MPNFNREKVWARIDQHKKAVKSIEDAIGYLKSAHHFSGDGYYLYVVASLNELLSSDRGEAGLVPSLTALTTKER